MRKLFIIVSHCKNFFNHNFFLNLAIGNNGIESANNEFSFSLLRLIFFLVGVSERLPGDAQVWAAEFAAASAVRVPRDERTGRGPGGVGGGRRRRPLLRRPVLHAGQVPIKRRRRNSPPG